MPFIVSRNVDKLDNTTRMLIRRHVMSGKKKQKPAKSVAAGLLSAGPTTKHRTQVDLREVIDMYTSLQPGCFGTRIYDYPPEMDPSMLRKMQQGVLMHKLEGLRKVH